MDHPRPITACRPTRQAGRIAHEPAARTQRPRRDFRGSHAEDHPHRLFNAPRTPLNPIPSNSPTLAAIRTLATASPRSAAQRTCAAVASPLRRTPASTSRRRSSARMPRTSSSPQPPTSAPLRTGFPVEKLHRAAPTPPRFLPCDTSQSTSQWRPAQLPTRVIVYVLRFRILCIRHFVINVINNIRTRFIISFYVICAMIYWSFCCIYV